MGKKISNSLVTLSSAAILAVYAAGYERTSPAAERFASQIAQRRTPAPIVEAAPPTILTPPSPEAMAATPTSVPTPKAFPVATPSREPSIPTPAVAENVVLTPVVVETPAVPISQPAETTPEPVKDQPKAAPPAIYPAIYKDGTYLGWGYSRHGNIQAFVVIEGGRIAYAGIEKCNTRWSCSLVEHLPPQVIQRQSAAVDFVTGATQSGDAFYGGIVEALSKAK